MLGIGTAVSIHAAHSKQFEDAKSMDNTNDLIIAYGAVDWWDEHKDEKPFMFWTEPDFVTRARALINVL
jgi:hypothetical protein